jgi:hypothetical protein
MSPPRLLIVSIAANLLMAGAVVHFARQRRVLATPRSHVTTTVVTNIIPPPPATNAAPPVLTNDSRFHWSALESAEYPTYIANLRAIGCPELTIRDIVLPDIEELYRKKRRELAVERDFWISGPARAAADRERDRKLVALDAKAAALVKGLLGLDSVRERNSGFNSKFETVLLPYLMTRSLSLEKTRQMMGVILKYEALERQVREETRGILLPEDEAKLKELRAQMKDDVAQLLPAQEFEEFRLRLAAIQELNDPKDLTDAGISISPDELRQIVRIKSAGHEAWDGGILGFSRGEESSPAEQRLAKLEADVTIQKLLGETRYAKYQEATDDELKSATRFVQQQKLPQPMGGAIYEIQQAAQDRALEIQDDPSLTPSQRRRAVKEVRTTTEAALSQTLGEKGMETYRKNPGGWLNELGRN